MNRLRIGLKPIYPMVPSQSDSWSCGHRMILILNRLFLAITKGPQPFSLENLEVNDEMISDVALRSLCEKGVSALLVESEPLYSHQAPKVAPKKRPAASLCGKPPGVKAEPNRDPAGSGKVAKKPQPDRQKRPAEDSMSLSTAPLKDQKDEESDVIQSLVGNALVSREVLREEKRLEDKAKNVLRRCGLSYNLDFQKGHRGVEWASFRGHWKEFLLGVLGEKDVACDICRSLIARFSIDRVAQEYVITPPRKKRAVPAVPLPDVPRNSDAEGEGDADAAMDPQLESPPKKRAKAGRPGKHDNDTAFDLMKYLREKREGLYRLLAEEEAIEIACLEEGGPPPCFQGNAKAASAMQWVRGLFSPTVLDEQPCFAIWMVFRCIQNFADIFSCCSSFRKTQNRIVCRCLQQTSGRLMRVPSRI